MSNGSFFALCALILIAPKMSEKLVHLGFVLFATTSIISSIGAWVK